MSGHAKTLLSLRLLTSRNVNTLKPTGWSSTCAHISLLCIIHWQTYDSTSIYWSW